MSAPTAARVPYAMSLSNVRFRFRLGWRQHGASTWQRWRAWSQVRESIARAIADVVADGRTPDPALVDFYRRVDERCGDVEPR